MSRSDSMAGLNHWARKFVKGETVSFTENTTRIYSDGREEVMPPKEVETSLVESDWNGDFCSGYDDHPLRKYIFPDGKVYFEYEQAQYSSSGPVFFLALKDEDGRPVQKSLWSKKAIQKHL